MLFLYLLLVEWHLIYLNSVFTFFVALLIFSFQNTSMKIWISVGGVAGVVVISMIWCIKNTWEKEGQEKNYQSARAIGTDYVRNRSPLGSPYAVA